jgi:CRP-like cAMP-binding protein
LPGAAPFALDVAAAGRYVVDAFRGRSAPAQPIETGKSHPVVDSFWGNIFRQTDEESVYSLLRDIPLFDELSSGELSSIESILHRREYDPGEVLFHQGNPGVGMYIIREGTIEIVYEPTGDTLVELADGDFFGELALLNETPRSATAVAQTESVLYGLFRPDLLGLVERDPSLGVQLLLRMSQVISERLIQTNEQVQELREQLHELRENGQEA